MKFYNMQKIMDNVDVHNKYLLTSVVAQRARQISNEKGVNQVAMRHPGEKPISLAMADMEDDNVRVRLQEDNVSDAISIKSEIEGENIAKKEEAEAAVENATSEEA